MSLLHWLICKAFGHKRTRSMYLGQLYADDCSRCGDPGEQPFIPDWDATPPPRRLRNGWAFYCCSGCHGCAGAPMGQGYASQEDAIRAREEWLKR